MATSGTFKTDYVNGGYSLIVDWSIVSQNIAANTSDIKVDVKLKSNGSGYNINSSQSKDVTLTINGKSYSTSVTAALTGNQTRTLFSKTVTVPHNSDGSKTCAIAAKFSIEVTLSGTYYSAFNASGNAVLEVIPRASTIASVTPTVDVNGTNAVTVTISRKSSAFTHDVEIKFGTYTHIVNNVATSAAYAIPQSWLAAIPNATSGTATVTVTTKSGSTKIGDAVSKTFKITVPATVKPTFSTLNVARIDNGVPSTWGIYVQGKSKCKATISGASGAYGSTIAKYEIAIGATKGNADTLTADLPTAGTITIKATVTDSRGRTFERTDTIDVKAYSNPRLTKISLYRAIQSGTADDEGTYIGGNITFAYSAIGNNSVNTSIEYRLAGSSDWTYAGTFQSGKAFTLGGGNLGVDNSYEIRIGVADSLGWVGVVQTISTGFTTMDLLKGGKGIAFGKAAEAEGMDVNFDAHFRKPVQFDHAVYTNSGISLVTPRDGITLTNIYVTKWARMVHIYVNFKVATAINNGNITNMEICTLPPTLRPMTGVCMCSGAGGIVVTGYLNANGNVTLTATTASVPANQELSLGCTFICSDTSGII